MHKLLFTLLLLTLFNFRGLSQLGLHGSFCIGAIGRDGIILAADTRGVLFNRKAAGTPTICYFDSMQKVFQVNRFGLAFVGNSTVSGFYLSALISHYRKTDFSKAKGDSIIFHFLKFCKKVVPDSDWHQIEGIEIMSVGYENGKPYVCSYNYARPLQYIKNPKSRLCTDNCKFFDFYSDTLNCKQLSKYAEEGIYDYAKTRRREEIIGGAIMVLQISKNGKSKWILHSPAGCRKWVDENDMAKDYRLGKIKMTMTTDSSKKILDKYLLRKK